MRGVRQVDRNRNVPTVPRELRRSVRETSAGVPDTVDAKTVDREKADLKLLEQQVAAEKLKAKRPTSPAKPPGTGVDAKLDKALKDSFPGSDPVSSLEAPIKKADRALSTVPPEEPKLKK